MMERTRATEDTPDLLDDIPFLWESQGPQGKMRGVNAIVELLYRWDYLPDDWWAYDASERRDMVHEMSMSQAVATIAHEADQRGLSHNLYL